MAVNAAVHELPHDLPRLPGDWEFKSLGEIVRKPGICYGIVQPGRDIPDGVPIVRVNNIRNGQIDTTDVKCVSAEIADGFARSRLNGGEVLLTLVGTLGETAIVPKSLSGWNVARAVGVIPVNEEIGSRWVSLCLRSAFVQHYIQMWATTTVQATFNLRDVARLPIPIPPKRERDAIAHILGTLDDKIELNRRMNETLESMARALFKSWFVDFDPVRAKMDGRQPKGMSPEIAALFPDGFEHVDGDLVPTGWGTQKLGDVIAINQRTIRKGEMDGEVRYIDIASVAVGKSDGPTTMDFADAPSRARRRVDHGDTIWSCVRPNRRSFFYIHSPPENLLVSTGFAVLSPQILTSNYLYCFTTTQEFTDYLTNNADGSAYPAVRADHFAVADVLVPTKYVLEAFESTVLPIRDAIAINAAESKTLADLRDTLLPKLLSGEIRVGDAERIAEEVV